MDIFSAFATDEKVELDGAWFNLSKTAKVRVARAGNPNYLDLMRRKLEASGVDVEGTSKEDEEAAEAVVIEVMASTILLDWQGLEFKGSPMTYSHENARTLLAIKDFRVKVLGFARSFEAFKVKAEGAQGNA